MLNWHLVFRLHQASGASDIGMSQLLNVLRGEAANFDFYSSPSKISKHIAARLLLRPIQCLNMCEVLRS